MKFNSELLLCTKCKQLESNIKLQGKLFQKNLDKQRIKLSLKREQTIDEIFHNFTCLSLSL